MNKLLKLAVIMAIIIWAVSASGIYDGIIQRAVVKAEARTMVPDFIKACDNNPFIDTENGRYSVVCRPAYDGTEVRFFYYPPEEQEKYDVYGSFIISSDGELIRDIEFITF